MKTNEQRILLWKLMKTENCYENSWTINIVMKTNEQWNWTINIVLKTNKQLIF